MRGKVYKLDLSNNELKELSLFIEDEWNIHELDVSGNCITDEYMAGIGALKSVQNYININKLVMKLNYHL